MSTVFGEHLGFGPHFLRSLVFAGHGGYTCARLLSTMPVHESQKGLRNPTTTLAPRITKLRHPKQSS